MVFVFTIQLFHQCIVHSQKRVADFTLLGVVFSLGFWVWRAYRGVPAAKVGFPEEKVFDGSFGNDDVDVAGSTECWVQEMSLFLGHKTPERMGLLPDFVKVSLLVGIVQKGSEETGIQVVQDEDQKALVELKVHGELEHDLPDAIDKLEKDGGSVVAIMLVFPMTDPMCKLVTIAQPFLLNQNLKAFQCPVVRVQEHHGQRG